MENLTLKELKFIQDGLVHIYDLADMRGDFAYRDEIREIGYKVEQAIADKEFEEKTRPLNF